ncbi:FtsX-like permease family protein [Ekhidna sp.]|uniref:ABC transporter permease n=1 Tax=Ekhidna sp. TaxID=2608089 RepID=UPI0032EBAB91
MFKSYLISAFRNLFKHKSFSVINILGLTGGLTACLLIYTYVADELNYDNFHAKKDRIYRVRYDIADFNLARIPPIMGEHIATYFPEVESTSRLFSRSVSVQVPKDDGSVQRFEEGNVNFADATILSIFDFELVQGSLEGALTQPFTVIINDEIATKYFGDENPVGKSIIMEGENTFKVIAVTKDFPSNSHVHFDMILPYDNMYDLEPVGLEENVRQNFKMNWMVSHSPTYVLLKEGASPKSVDSAFPEFIAEKIPENMQKNQSFSLQPLHNIHLNDEIQAQAEASGSRSFLFIFIAVGALTLLIACINFINLSTARSLQRAKEIGMRKVLGAWKSNLITQFLGESFLTAAIAAFLALIATYALLPQLNELTGKELETSVLFTSRTLIGLIVLFLLTGFLAGMYPAFYVTKIAPISSLKGEVSTNAKGGLAFRKGLIIVQFTISMILISCTLIVFDQLDMMRNRPLGFQRDHIITIPIQSQNFNNVFGGVNESLRQKMNAFEDAIAGIPGVLASTVSAQAPGFGMVNRNVIPEGFTAQDNIIAPVYAVDYDFIDTYEIAMVAGRDFSKGFGTDHLNAFLVNEYALQEYNFGTPEEALGKGINIEGKEGKIIGVVQDFNFLALTEPMRPLIMEISVAQFAVFSIKIENLNVPETLAKLESEWNTFFPDETFNSTFLDESLDQGYNQQEQLGTTVGYFSFLAILISCLGSYGLIMFIASQKMKEVGIRKVLGASVTNIVLLLSKRFALLAVVSMIISIPVSIWLANDWLSEFSYRIDISPMSFIIASLLTLLMVIITISFQAFKTAFSNPVNSLRSE